MTRAIRLAEKDDSGGVGQHFANWPSFGSKCRKLRILP